MRTAYYNDRPLYGQRTGVGHYLDLVRAYWPEQPRIELRGFTERVARRKRIDPKRFVFPEVAEIDRLRFFPLSELRPPRETAMSHLRTRIARRGYERTLKRLAWIASKREDFGVVFEPNHLPSSALRPCVATIHDLSVIEHPEFHPAHRVDWWRRAMDSALETVDRFICVSRSTADAMVRVLGCSEQQIEVIELASRWGNAPASWERAAVRTRLAAPERYLLHVGTIEPRKNIIRLLDAYAAMSDQERSETKLVLCGRAGWGSSQFWSSIIEHPIAPEVRCAGYASDEQLAALMHGSLGTLCASHYEGFGLPTIESMSLVVPTAISRAPSLVEIADGSVPMIAADDTDGWRETMRSMCASRDEAQCERAMERARAFCWSATAQKHHDLMLSMIRE